jgi:hypothetical protein
MEWIVKLSCPGKMKRKTLHFKEKEISNAFVAENYIEMGKHAIQLFNITKVCARIELNP